MHTDLVGSSADTIHYDEHFGNTVVDYNYTYPSSPTPTWWFTTYPPTPSTPVIYLSQDEANALRKLARKHDVLRDVLQRVKPHLSIELDLSER